MAVLSCLRRGVTGERGSSLRPTALLLAGAITGLFLLTKWTFYRGWPAW